MKSSYRRLAIVAGILLLLVYLAGSWYFSSMIVSLPPQSLAQEQQRYGTPQDFGLPQPQEVVVPGSGVQLSGWLFENPAQAGCGVLMMHGRGGTRYGMLRYTPLFWPRGCDLLLLDLRAHGISQGQIQTYGAYEHQDALAALAWFAEQRGLQMEQIGIFGASYGAATALMTAAQQPDLAFVGADSAYRSLPAIVRYQAIQLFGDWIQMMEPGALAVAGLRGWFWSWSVSPEQAARRTQSPVFLLHAGDDDYTLPEHSQAIAAAISHTRYVLHITPWGGGHTSSMEKNPEQYRAYMNAFLDQYAPGFGSAQP